MFGLVANHVRPLRFSLSLLTLAFLLPIAAQAQSAGTCDGMQLGTTATAGTVGGDLNGFVPFPANNPWNTSVLNAAVDPNSSTIIGAYTAAYLGANFGKDTNAATGIPNNGIPYIVVDSSVTPLQPITVYGANASKSDVVVAPFPNTAGGVPIGGSATTTDEGGNVDCVGWPQTAPTGDDLTLVLDRNTCWLYETYGTTGCNGQYEAESETIWDMSNGESRPWGWPSAEGSGLPVFPGLVRYDEASNGAINHALAFTATTTETEGDANGGYFILPASHAASTTTTAHLAPMGTRLRLKSSVSISVYGPINQSILAALQNYGMILTDYGPNLNLEGVPDARWSDLDLALAFSIIFPLSDFDVIQMSPEYKGMDDVSAYTSTNPEYAGGHAIPVIDNFSANGKTANLTVSAGTPVTFEYTVTGDSYDYINYIGPERLTDGAGSVTITPNGSETYTLYSTNAWGRATSTMAVTVTGSTVAAPVFDPTPAQTGVLSAAQAVTISSPGSPAATIYYTLTSGSTGTTPTTASTKYNGTSITVDTGCTTQTAEAIAVDAGNATPSAVSTATYVCGAKAGTPTFAPPAGTYTSIQTVTISDTTGGVSIYYTTDGTTPTYPVSGTTTHYTAPVTVAVTQTLKAIALSSTNATSAVGSAAYTITSPTAATPTLSPGTGTYTSIQTVTISDTTPGVTIYYVVTAGTLGAIPTTASTVYTGPITVANTEVINALAGESGYTNSTVATGKYTITLGATVAAPAFSPIPGSYGGTQTVTISDTTPSSNIYYTLTAGTTGAVPAYPPTAATHLYTGPVTIAATSVLEAIGQLTGDNNSPVTTGRYTLTNPVVATPTMSPAGTLTNVYTTPETITISDTTAGSTIYYTVGTVLAGTAPTTASTLYTGPFTLSADAEVEAFAIHSGDQNSAVDAVNYYFDLATVDEPTFNPGTGAYAGAQTVTISDGTGGATIYYTVTSGYAGTTPTTASSLYSTPISVTPPSVVEALGVKSPYPNSTVAEAVYSLETAAPTPTFNPPAGNYYVAQYISINDGAPSATIYYTTDGSTPSTNSARYGGIPIKVVGSATPTVIEAIATANGYTQSAIGSATYNIPIPAQLTIPTPGTTLTGTTVTFGWTPGSASTHFELWLGTTGAGSTNLYNSGSVTATSEVVTNLPSNGEMVYARLYFYVFGTWQENDYTYTAYGSPQLPYIESPTPGTQLGSSALFTWNPGNIASAFQLYVGSTGVGSSNIYSSGYVTATSENVSGIPANGETVNVRLWWLVGATWSSADYTYTTTGAITPAALTTPVPGTTLTGTSVTFGWTPGNTATHFELWLGSKGVGTSNLYNTGSVTATSEIVGGLPSNGEPLYARLYYMINGNWISIDYTYTAYGSATPASLTTPTPGSKLGGTRVTFSWNPGNRATTFQLFLGTTGVGSNNIYNSLAVTATSETVSGLPDNGEEVYARLFWYINGSWNTADYTYTAAGTAVAAALTEPSPGTKLTGTSVTFGWNPGNIATNFELLLGNTGVGSDNLYNSNSVTVTSETVSDLPDNGEPVNARLYSYYNGAWHSSDYTYTAAGTPVLPSLSTPTPSSTLTGTSVTFTWNPGNAATHFELWVGNTTPGSTNIYDSGSVTATTETVSGLPANGEPVYVRLYYYLNGSWSYIAYTYTASGSPTLPALTTPTPSTTLTGTSVAFSWSPGNAAVNFELLVGTTGVGSDNLYNSNSVTVTTETVSDLPSNGAPVYVRLFWYLNGAWSHADYRYTAY